VNAIVVSREEVRAADAALARGEILGPFHGVPFTAKEVTAVAGCHARTRHCCSPVASRRRILR
jgi:Asp-tRNA(Asn)/Glu-tRNA(Gln) amidotransferase A subunit family amidase